MTTSPPIQVPCSTDRCSFEYPNGSACPYEERDDRHHGPPGVPNLNRHAYAPKHVAACDAEFWALLGCDVELRRDNDNVLFARCKRSDHAGRHATIGLAPILSAPETDASRLAVFDVWEEVERRKFTWGIYTSGEVPFVGLWAAGDVTASSIVEFDSLDTLPRAVAEAVKAALEAQGGK